MPATVVAPALLTHTNVIAAVSAANTAAATSSTVDLTGYEGLVTFVCNVGAVTGSITGKLQDSADDSTYADVTGATFSTTVATGIRTITVDVRNVRRYVKFIGTIVTGPVLVGVTMLGVKKVTG